MPELPFPPDLDQLRRQARELLRAAAQGESDAVARLHAVSDRVALSAAQLAVAREYGFWSWPALKAEVERDRSIDLGAKPPAPTAVSPDLLEPPEERRSFGGAVAIETAGGVLLPELLVVGPGHAVLDASLVLAAPAAPPPPAVPRQRPFSQKERRQVWQRVPRFGDVTVTDDRGTTYALKVRETEGRSGQPDEEPEPVRVIFRLEPAPAREVAWVELRAHDGPTTRLVTSPRAAVHVSCVTPVSAAEKDLEDLARSLIGTRLTGSPVGLRQRSIALGASCPASWPACAPASPASVRSMTFRPPGQACSARRTGATDPHVTWTSRPRFPRSTASWCRSTAWSPGPAAGSCTFARGRGGSSTARIRC